MSKRFINYREALLKDLQDPREAMAYLNAALMDEDPRVFLLALKDVVDAQATMSEIAKKAQVNRENLYRMLSKNGNPKLTSIIPVLQSLGLHLSIGKAKKK